MRPRPPRLYRFVPSGLRALAWEIWTGAWTAAAALAARALVGLALPAFAPYPLIFPAALAATLIAGWRAGAVCLLVGGPLAAALFVGPGQLLRAGDYGSAAELGLLALSAIAVVVLADRHRRAMLRVGVLTGAAALHREAMAESEARLRMAVEAAAVGIWEWRLATGEMIYSAEARAICGFSPDEPLDYDRIVAVTHPEDLPHTLAQAARALDPEIRDAAPYEYRIARPDGGERWVVAHGQAVFEQKEGVASAVRYVGTIVDVTARRRAEIAARTSEQRLALALEAGRMAVWETDAESRLAPSPSMNALIGAAPDARLTLEEIAANFLPGAIERFQEATTRALETGEDHYEIEFGYRAAPGDERWFNARARLLRGADGGPTGSIGVAMDVTERRAAEERVQLLNREIDHRANNLMAVIQGTVMLSRAATAEVLKDTIIGRLHALARAHQLLSETRWTGADLRRLVEEELLAFSLGDPARIAINGPDVALGPSAAQSMAMAIHELATNASKHGALSAPDGRVEVRWKRADGRLTLRWAETGGPAVKAPVRRGFGTTLLGRALAGVGAVRLDWRRDGLVCEIELARPVDPLAVETAAT